ncbi:cell division-specific peptidoglycan biosynthesis regulator FtsW [Fluviicoccus keumensis]|uniref:Probable peptidoglycan glycosyltransferase FtsW n=1 Tax=Fluviicoccus keumensis TaxID=1435465 RepID=A0A4Q7YF43_9GAMM|nr:putative lipid II flippase FtsW [Fluviicoccus keumensis]RZU35374.1 cell division-specific peptidoglycan biosynthesis regulator FtsW [Fluviicoccus keumensis]
MKFALPRVSIPRHWVVPNWEAEFTPARLLMLSAGMLACIGVIMVASASMGVAEATFGHPFYFFVRHLLYVLLGVSSAIVVVNIPMHFWQRFSWHLLVFAFVLLVLVLIPHIGKRINGSARWLGVGPFTIQPSEIGKFAVVLFMAGYLVRRQEEVRTTYVRGFLRAMMIVGTAIALFLSEPDFGASLVLMTAVLGMLFLAGAPMIQFGGLVSAVVAGGIAAIVFEPYRLRRVMSFTDPWDDQYGSDYQLSQSLIAFGRGDWFGVGLGHSVQKLFYLPEAHTDFVFAVYAEEFGLVGVLFLMSMFWILINSGLRIGRAAEQTGRFFEAYLAYGISFLIIMQAVINIGVNTGFFPTKGLTLPMVSYGGSSLIVVFTMLGLLLRIDMETRQGFKGKAHGR